MNPVTIDELRSIVAFSALPDEHLQWILDRTEYNEFEDGRLVIKKGEEMNEMFILIEGATPYYMEMSGQQVYFYTFENTLESGGVSGLLPYSRMTNSPGYAYASGLLRRLRLHKKYFAELEQLNPELIQRLIAVMTNRARSFATIQLQKEKASALGKLASGIAHELNNPAAAITRIGAELNQRLELNFQLTNKLLFHKIGAGQIEEIHKVLPDKTSAKPALSAVQRMENEDEIRDWLEDHNISDDAALSETFSAAGVNIKELESILEMTGEDPFSDVAAWLENLLASRKIIADLVEASGHVSSLVGAIKSHVQMDRSTEMKPTKVSKDIEDTLTLLGYKLREKNIEVELKYDESIPEADAYVGELNQVWMNIIDNAIFASPENGKLIIEIFNLNNDLKVNIIDNGTGIPPDVLPRIFDPFFTTKKVGEGTGLGLDVASRFIKRHNGVIKATSAPGRTEFSISIPVHQEINKKELTMSH